MPPGLMRRGKRPREAGAAWMWARGEMGLWPPSGGASGGASSGTVMEWEAGEGEAEVGMTEEETRGLVDALRGMEDRA